MTDLSRLLDSALAAADVARRLALDAIGRPAGLEAKAKDDGSWVTALDLAVEQALRELLLAATPGAPFFGEETAVPGAPPPATGWIVDPIDGTRQLLRRQPLFGTLIAFVEDGEPCVGVMDYPRMGERLYAATGHGCWFADASGVERVRVSDGPAALAEAVVSATGIDGTAWRPAGGTAHDLGAVMGAVREALFVSDSYQHGCVARGLLHAAIDPLMKPWDIAAIVPCVREAGGVCAAISGGGDLLSGGSLVTACTASLAGQVCSRLRGEVDGPR